jgi:hypothetical protein
MRCDRALAIAAVVAWIGSAPAASAQTAADLFDTATLQDVRLFMNSKDLQQLRAHYMEPTRYTVDLLWRGTRVRNAAVRSRGTGSANPVKPGLRIDFDRYTTGQRFVGLRTLVLDNLWQDPSMLREFLAMALFTRLGHAAPRQSFCRLFVNDQYFGVYALTEEPDAELAARAFEEAGGYVFEYRWVRPFYGEYLGADLAAYKPIFEPRTRELEADSTLYRPIEELFRRVNEADDAVWRERVEEYLDLTQFVTQVAVETFIAEDDGILGYAGMNNFYLYRSSGGTRHRVVPWDKDNAFLAIEQPLLARAGENVWVSRALAYPDLRAHFFQVLEQCARVAAGEEWLAAEIERMRSLIADAAYADPLAPYTDEEFDRHVEFLREFARRRPSFVQREVASLRRDGAAPAPPPAGPGGLQDRIVRWPNRRYPLPPDPNPAKSPSSGG